MRSCFKKKFFSFTFSLLALNTLLCSSIVLADDNQCSDMSGAWDGIGKIKVFLFTCEYNVVANVQQGNPANGNVTVNKKSGNFLCPSQATENIVISCINQKVDIKSDRVNLIGLRSADGSSAALTGNVTVLKKSYPFSLDLHRRK